ncbi:MAG: 4-hydroxythreonine-4-phosphate dehydrogenase PdxA [Bradyrhizobiaceae bacterium]|nr:4-hydroxythreonine-4-phosphate dehydrogenase PdxA [Bradyrhizobiaceae bacterium]
MSRSVTRPLALTLGEPAGIGPDLTLALWAKREALGVPPFLLLGDPALLEARARALGLTIRIAECGAADAAARFSGALPVQPIGLPATAAPGKPDATSGPAARAAIEQAVALVQAGKAAAVVTNPIAKSVMQQAGFPFPGHTEFLAALAAAPGGQPPKPVMLIWSEELAVVPVTIHVPLAEVPRLVTTDLIVETGRIVAREFTRRFGIARPRLAVCGLNPHAGEQGTIGREDETIVRPAVAKLKAEDIEASGPYPADTLFHRAARARYDVVLGMYHDQVLIPAKTLAFDRAVNVTLGLPFVRTSPDHGTAFDLAGTGKADPSSLLAALRLAERLARAEAPAPAA